MSAIREIALAKAIGGSGGGSSVTVESLTVTENKTYTAPSGKAYSPVNAAVPNSYSAGDEGKVVSDGALVAQTSRTVNANNTYDTTLNNEMVVNVQPPLQEKTVNANGDVTPDTGYYGLSKVRVAVPPVSGDGYTIKPELFATGWRIDNATTLTFSFSIKQDHKVIHIIEIPSYTGAVTFSDPEKYTVLYSDNTQGITRMILVNNDTLGEDGTATFTVTINVSKTIRSRYVVLSNVGNITFVRSNAQGAADNMKRCTVENLVSGFAMYVCFGNVNTYSSAPYDFAEQWYMNSGLLYAINISSSSPDWPQIGAAMPATVFLKWSIRSVASVVFYQPRTTLDHPNVCELSLAIRE